MKMYSSFFHAHGEIVNLNKNIFIEFCLVIISFQAHSQRDTLIFNPIHNQVLQNTEIRNLTIAQDGTLWLSTNKGVASFDGNEVNFFGHKESDNISSMWTSSISFLNPYEDKKGNLYVVTVSGPTYYFNTKTGKTVYLEIAGDNRKNYIPQPYADMYVENDSSLWLARYNGRFLHYEASLKRTTYYDITDSETNFKNIVTRIRADENNKGLLWLATKNGIYSFNTKSRLLQRNFNCQNVKDSSGEDIDIVNMEAGKDTIWFTAGEKGVGCYDIHTGLYTIFPYHTPFGKATPLNIKYFQKKNSDEYYIGMEDRNPGTFNIKTHQYSFKTKIIGNFPSLQIQKFTADKNGNCWCLILGQLFYASNKHNKFTTVQVSNTKSQNNLPGIFKTVLYDKYRHCYYAAFDRINSVFVLDKNLELIKTIPILSQRNIVTDIALDNNGNLWMTGDGLFLYDTIKNQMRPVENSHFNRTFPARAFQNLVLRENYLYTITSNPPYRSIYRINTNTLSTDSIPLPEMMLDPEGKNQFGVLVIDSKSNYAYISNNRTLYQFNLKNRSTRLIIGLRFESIPFSFYSNFHWYEVDDNDNLWVSSNGVIRVYDPDNLKVEKKIYKDHQVYVLQSANLTHQAIMGFVNSGGVELFDYQNNMQYQLSLSDGLNTKRNSGIACANNILFTGGELNALQYMPLDIILNQHSPRTCFVSTIQLFNQPLTTDTIPRYLHSIELPYDKNFLTLTFSSLEFDQPERLDYRYRLRGVDKDWVYVDYLHRTISYPDLKPGNYFFSTGIKNSDGSWSDRVQNLNFYIIPAWWQTSWFKVSGAILVCFIVLILVRWRINVIRKQEQHKIKNEKQMLELEARALRAQMNPHFIFNCMNSIKVLIQQKNEDKAVTYLTVFAKLIRTIFQNSDKREITLFDEIETCKLYTQLESMRFGKKFSYHFNIDETFDLKSVQVPALIMQPLIENAIWHGIMPKEEGGTLTVTVSKEEDAISCVIDDNGIGRKMSMQNKFKREPSTHQSRGVHLTRSRLNLSNSLSRRNASVEIIDKYDEAGKSVGTKIVLIFTE